MIVIKIRSDLLVLCLALLTLTGCAPTESNTGAPILLFNGTGTSAEDVAAIARILKERGFEYDTANSRRLNGMNESQLMAYRLLIVPGGNYIKIGDNLTPETTRRVQSAVEGVSTILGFAPEGFWLAKPSPTVST